MNSHKQIIVRLQSNWGRRLNLFASGSVHSWMNSIAGNRAGSRTSTALNRP